MRLHERLRETKVALYYIRDNSPGGAVLAKAIQIYTKYFALECARGIQVNTAHSLNHFGLRIRIWFPLTRASHFSW